jgi:ABC-type Fe3+/spermidine/putrescine transport system ATPase subunit
MIEVSGLLVRYGEVTAVNDVAFTVFRGEHLTLLGPSGCGKTTTLRSIAGLEDPTSGAIVLGGISVYDSRRRLNVPTEKRGLSMVFQSYAIWPHMTVFENVAYGLRTRRQPERVVKAAVERSLELVQMTAYAGRAASELSGGQQQRVALARAFAFEPKIILFDEPLSNLDAKLRIQMRRTIRQLQDQIEFTSVYVTHDQEEALAISDRVVVMNEGRVEQAGTPAEIYNCPRSRFVADFVGSANLLSGRVRAGGAAGADVLFDLDCGLTLKAMAPHACTGAESNVAVRTAYIRVESTPDEAANSFRATVTERVFLGDFVEYTLRWAAETLIVRRPPTEVIAEGSEVWIVFRPADCVLLEH